MKGSLDDNYSIPRFPSIDENLNVSRKRSIARRPFNKAFLFLFLHFPRPPPPMATFSLPSQGENQSDAMPDTRDPGRRSPLGRSPIEEQSEGRGKGSSRESSLETAAAAAPSVPVVQGRCKGRKKGGEMKDERETSFGWLSLVITLLGSIMESVACHGTWASWSVSTIGPRSEKVIDERSRQAPFDFYLGNELIHSSLIFFGESRYNIVHAAYENYSSTVSPLIK